MKDEWELQLQEKFPFMKQNRVDEETNVYRRWGCECSGGWYRLLCDLCQEITDRYVEDGLEVDIVVRQVKEKMASLRFYYTHEDIADESKQSLRDDVARIVHSYEEKKQNDLRILRTGWGHENGYDVEENIVRPVLWQLSAKGP